MRQQQKCAAGDKAVGDIEHGEYHKICFDHIHHIAKAEAVDHVADAAAINGNDQPALEIRKGPALAGKLPYNGRGEQNKDHHKQPLSTLKGGEGSAGIADVGQVQQAGDKVHMTMQRDILQNKIFGKLIGGYNTGRK